MEAFAVKAKVKATPRSMKSAKVTWLKKSRLIQSSQINPLSGLN
jgi:hypothetical protein